MQRATGGWVSGGYPLLSAMLGVVLCCTLLLAGALASDAAVASDGICPNETLPGFRVYLPECRAYELVSPIFKQGFEPKIEAVSEDGTQVIMRSLGAFAGLEGGDTKEGARYELSRAPSGWKVSAISPPASLLPAQELVATSSDLAKTMYHARMASESTVADNFYIREASGGIVEVGPLLPPTVTTGAPAGESESFTKALNHYVDASSDLAHVFYKMPRPVSTGGGEGDAWAGDKTVGSESLLEYSGTGNTEPELVGVKPGPEEAKNKPSEDPELISTCGTSLGSRASRDIYNAVSTDGNSVFFTAIAPPFECEAGETPEGEGPEVNELYARLNGRETVPISEPSLAQCAACDTSSKAPAEFAGASQDGSKVFFLTEQELLPGAKGMNLYEYDFDSPAGNKVVRASIGSGTPEVQGVARVSEDGSHVYFVAAGVLSGPNSQGVAPSSAAGAHNLYVFERDVADPAGRIAFIATLSDTDAEDWAPADIRPVQATPDGRFLVFETVADLTPGDTSSVPQIFEYDAATGELVRVSRGSTNDEPTGTESANVNGSQIGRQTYHGKTSPATSTTNLEVSDDGSIVVFANAGVLTDEAIAGTPSGRFPQLSAYEYRSPVADGGTISEGNVSLISPPGPPAQQLDGAGQDVFFLSADPLVPQDTDTQVDLYDARVGGGFPSSAVPVECGGAGCAPPAMQSSVGAPGSANVVGDGNVVSSQSTVPVVEEHKPRALSRAQKLAKALKVCRRDRKRVRRVGCERAARRRYGVAKKAGDRGAGR